MQDTYNYLKKASIKPLCATEQTVLFLKWRDNGDMVAKRRLDRSLYGLIISFANRRHRDHMSTFEDMLQLAFLALERAYATYNPTKGRQFSGHFYNRLDSETLTELKKNQIVSLPSSVNLDNAWIRVSFSQTEMDLDFGNERREPMLFVDAERQDTTIKTRYKWTKKKNNAKQLSLAF